MCYITTLYACFFFGLHQRSWFKGADTVVVMKYLVAKYRGLLESGDLGSNRNYVETILACLEASDGFMSTLYKSGLFLNRLRLTKVVRLGKEMLSSYAKCADQAYAKQLARYKYNPKYHMLCHIVQWLDHDCNLGKSPVNPLSYSCQMPEDFINKCATFSRCVQSRMVARRTIDLYKVGVGTALRD